MKLVVLLLALVIEQIRPLPYARMVGQPLTRLSNWVESVFDSGNRQHGFLAWLLIVGGGVLLATLLDVVLSGINLLLGLIFGVIVLYLTLGFRQFSHSFTEVNEALQADDVPAARKAMKAWNSECPDNASSDEIARLAIETGVLASHRHVFGVLAWFVVFGPVGAVFYRLTAFLATHWNGSDRKDEELVGEHAAEEVQVKRRLFGAFARQAFALVDWLPARMTAVAFAIVGNFEDAIYCWREQASTWRDHTAGVIVAAGAGALGVKLGGELSHSPVIEDDAAASDRPEIGVGEEATPAILPSAIGLVWRALILWVILLAVVGLAAWVGV